MVIVIAVVIIAKEMPLGPNACSLTYASACRQYEIVKSLVLLLIAGSVASETSGHQRAGKQTRAGSRQAGRQAGRLIVVGNIWTGTVLLRQRLRHMPSSTVGTTQQRHES